MLALDLIFVLFFIAVVGEPLRTLVSHYTRFFADLDGLQILILDVFLGGFLLYALASFPLGLFNFPVLAAVLIFSVVFVGVKVVRHVRGTTFDGFVVNLNASKLIHFASAVSALLIFSLVLWIELTPMNTIVLGSVADVSLHSMFVQLLINNKMIPSTHMPFLPEALIFPQGHTVIFGTASVLLNWGSAKAVFYVTPLFMALSTLGAYFLGKTISGKPSFGAILACVTGFVATHPRYLTWGGNAFIVAFPFFMVYLGMLYSNVRVKNNTKVEIFVKGLLLGYLAAMYLPAFLVIALLLICDAVFNLAARNISLKNIDQYLLLLSVSILVIFPNVFRFLSFSSLPGGNVGLPSDVEVGLQNFATPNPFWTLETIMIQPFPINAVALSLIVFGIFALAITQKSEFEKKLIGIATSTFIIPTSLLFLANNILWISMFVGACTCVFVFVSTNLLAAFFINYILSGSVSLPQSLNNLHGASTHSERLKLSKVFVDSALLFILLSPFISYSIINDEAFLIGGYNCFAVTTQDDYNLMLWMKDNLNGLSTRILANPYDAGTFIPSVSNMMAVYPYSGSQLSASYIALTSNLHFGKRTKSEYDIMKILGITHVFIGSKAAMWWTGDHKWYPKFFLDSPNFKLVKNIGEAYLLEVTYKNPNRLFQDDFDYINLSSQGWNVCVPQQFSGAGTGDASPALFVPGDDPYLRIRTQKNENASLYWYSITKDVYLGDYAGVTNNIMIGFTFELHSGFGSNDAMMMIISSGDWQQQIYFTTSKNIGVKEEILVPANPAGLNEFNLSKIWYSIHGTLPHNAFHLQIVIHDTDPIENIAFIEKISITSNDA